MGFVDWKGEGVLLGQPFFIFNRLIFSVSFYENCEILHRRLHAKNKLEFKRFYKQSRFTIQKNNILCINKFGGKNNSPPKKCNQFDSLFVVI